MDNLVKERSFVHVGDNMIYKKATNSDFNWEIISLDTISKRAIISIKTLEIIQDLWFSSLKLGVKYNRNFISILPGKHQIEISYEGDIPKKEDFIVNWR